MKTTTINLNSDIVRSIVAISHATDKDRTCATLTGIFLRIHDGTCFITATDGKILATHEHVVEDIHCDLQCILSWNSQTKTTQQALKFLAKDKKTSHTFTFTHTDDYEYLDGDRELVSALTIEGMKIELVTGQYPQYQSAVPEQAQHIDSGTHALSVSYLLTLTKVFILPKSSTGLIQVTQGTGKGVMFYPIHQGTYVQRALIIPMRLAPEIQAKYQEYMR